MEKHMKSPFPGMDPYIEGSGLWADFHNKLIGEIERALAPVLPERYFVQTGERAYVVLAGTDEKDAKPIYPDVGIEESVRVGRASQSGGERAVIEAEVEVDSVTMQAFIEEHFRENFIEIYEAEAEPRLVTCIEVLSPSNKRGGKKGWKLYRRKRNALLLGKANLVEIDLVRGGRRMPMVGKWPESPYYLLVARESRAPSCRVWPAYFDRSLPTVPVPLAHPDPDIPLALQPMIEAVYERSRYARRIDYTKPSDPPLTPEQSAWLQERLRGADKPDKPPAPRPRKGRRR